jgi:hypothetical protein
VVEQGEDAGRLLEFADDGRTLSSKPTLAAEFLSTVVTGATRQSWSAVVTRQLVLARRNPAYGFYASQGSTGLCEGTNNLSPGNRDFIDAPALADPGSSNASVIGFRNYTGFGLRLVRSGPGQCLGINNGEVPGLKNEGFPANVVLSAGSGNGTGYVLDVEQGLTSFLRASNSNPDMMLTRLGVTYDAGVVGLAFTGTAQQPQLAFATRNELVITSPPLVHRVPGSSFSRPTATADGVIVVDGANGQLRTFSTWADSGIAERLPALGGLPMAQRPAAAIAGSTELYALADSTSVFAIRRSDGGVTTLAPPREIEFGRRLGEPTLWCRSGRSNALLAFTTSTGSLVALIVDSPRVDPSAPWPLPFHDTQNSNAADTMERLCP